MRVVIVNKFWYLKGGSERYVFLLKELLECHGHEVIPFAMDDERNEPTPWSTNFVSHVDFWEAADAVPNQTNFLAKLERIFWSREAARKLDWLLTEIRPDIVHLHNFNRQISPSILPVITRHNIPVVWTVHDVGVIHPLHPVSRGAQGSVGAKFLVWLEHVVHHRILRISERHIDRILCPARFLAASLQRRGWHGVIHLPFPAPVPRERPIVPATDRHRALFVGRNVPGKGLDVLCAAARRTPKLRVDVLGADGPPAGVRAPKNVSFLGVAPPTRVAERIARARFLVVPSTIDEVQPFVILEALAAGTPTIASRVGGIPELIDDGVTGVLVPPGDPRALARAMQSLYGDTRQRERMGTRAQQVAVERYALTSHYQDLIDIYEELIRR